MDSQGNHINRHMATVLTALACLFLATPAQGRAPELRLIPSDVTALLRETTQSAKRMEQQLKDHVDIFDAKMELYQQTQCEGSDSPGCREISRQIQEQYLQMLGLMQTHLPEIKRGIASTRRMLGGRMKSVVGRGMTPAEITKSFENNNQLPALRESRYNLSDRLEKYYQLILNKGDMTPLIEVASLIYLDSDRSLQILDLLEAHISRQEQVITLNEAFGEVTPEMLDTMGAVKNVIFGEEASVSQLPGQPQGFAGGRMQRELD